MEDYESTMTEDDRYELEVFRLALDDAKMRPLMAYFIRKHTTLTWPEISSLLRYTMKRKSSNTAHVTAKEAARKYGFQWPPEGERR